MEAIKLSIYDLFIKWTTFCVDWFMNLFADPEYYWVDETYPRKTTVSNIQKQKVEKTKILITRTYNPLKNKILTKISSISILKIWDPIKNTYKHLVQAIYKTHIKYIVFNI